MRGPDGRRGRLAALALALASAGAGAEAAPPRAAPPIHADTWINSEPLTEADLRGRVVLVEFWTFACWNCQNVEPWVRRWHERYAGEGLVVVAVHTPELSFEHDLARLRAYVAEHDLRHPIAVDNGRATWRRFGNWAWPAFYLIDRRGVIRHVRLGEGGYDETEGKIRALLAEDAN